MCNHVKNNNSAVWIELVSYQKWVLETMFICVKNNNSAAWIELVCIKKFLLKNEMRRCVWWEQYDDCKRDKVVSLEKLAVLHMHL